MFQHTRDTYRSADRRRPAPDRRLIFPAAGMSSPRRNPQVTQRRIGKLATGLIRIASKMRKRLESGYFRCRIVAAVAVAPERDLGLRRGKSRIPSFEITQPQFRLIRRRKPVKEKPVNLSDACADRWFRDDFRTSRQSPRL